MKTHLDLFSGIAGFALAASWAGYRTVGFCEIDPFCRRVIAKHFPGVPIHDDARTLTADVVRGWLVGAEGVGQRADAGSWDGNRRTERSDRGTSRTEVRGSQRVDLLTAGYPCQPFSHAGRRLGEADDRHLWPHVLRLLGALRPRWVLLENVAGHVTLGLDDVLADLEGHGYAWGAAVIPAVAVNAPHRRDRVWIVAHAERPERGPISEGRHGANGHDAGRQEAAGWPGADGQERLLWPLADAPDGGLRRGPAPGPGGLAALGGEAAADAAEGYAQVRGAERGLSEAPRSERPDGPRLREALGNVGRGIDGLPAFLDRPERAWGADWEAGIPRTVEGRQPDRVNRLKALGNAIVPQVAYEIIRAIDDAA